MKREPLRLSELDDAPDSLDTILALIKQMEGVVLGLRQVRAYVGEGVGARMVDVLIEESETGLAAVKRRVIQ